MFRAASRLRFSRSCTRSSSSARLMSSTSSSPDAFVYLIQPGSGQTEPGAQRLWANARTSKSTKTLDTRVIFEDDAVKSLVSLGDSASWAKKTANARRETIRKAAGKGIGKVRDLSLSAGVKTVEVNADGDVADAHAAAVGAALGLHSFTLKTDRDANPGKGISITPASSLDNDDWIRGRIYAGSQILARQLMEYPGNMMTPTIFSKRIRNEANGQEGVEVIIRDEAWIKEKEMNSFLSVAKGSAEPPKLVEIHYKGAPDPQAQPLVLVGKGITFDSGGISLKPGSNMKLMRGDMGGAAAVCAAALGIAEVGVPINVVAVAPLCENMPGPAANKPGDIVYAMNGRSIEIDNTDAEGRLILADALYYASKAFNAHTVIDVATLTGAMETALGTVYSGVFSTSDSLWEELHAAGEYEFDRFWRMPLDSAYGPQINGSNADLCNTGGKPGGCCTAALFLRSFVDGIGSEDNGYSDARLRWAHIDIAGSMEATRNEPYQYKGMTGRPTRALMEFAERLAQR